MDSGGSFAAAGDPFVVRSDKISYHNRQYQTYQRAYDNFCFQNRLYRNTLYCLYKEKFQPHKEITFVADYDMIFRSPFKVEVMVYEKSIVGYVSYLNSYMYFDKDGIIVENTSHKLEGIPQIDGLEFGQIVLGEPLPIKDMNIFTEILNLTQVLSLYDMNVERIHYDAKGQATLILEM